MLSFISNLGKKTPPTIFHLTRKDQLGQLYQLLDNQGNKISSVEIQLKFNLYTPLDIVLIVQLIIRLINEKIDINVSSKVDKQQNYLMEIGLFEFCMKNYLQPKTIKHVKNRKAMPIRRLETSTMVQYIDLAVRFIEEMCPTKDLYVLNLGLSELINNVYDHSKSPIGAYVFCQYNHRSGIIKLAVGDSGIGIPSSVNNFLKKSELAEKCDEDCINWAFEERKTSKSKPNNAGLGLFNVMNFIRSNKGVLSLISGDTYMKSNGGRNTYLDNPIKHFKGTVVELEIKVKNLPEKDGTIDDFEI